MPTYTDASEIMGPRRGNDLKGWLCPRDGSLIFIFNSGGVRISITKGDQLELFSLDLNEVKSLFDEESQEHTDAHKVLEQIRVVLSGRD
jgi:hypothetical protein